MRGISHQHASGSKVVGRALHRYHGLRWQQKVIVLQLPPSCKTTDTSLVGPQETRRASHAMFKLIKPGPRAVSALGCKTQAYSLGYLCWEKCGSQKTCFINFPLWTKYFVCRF